MDFALSPEQDTLAAVATDIFTTSSGHETFRALLDPSMAAEVKVADPRPPLADSGLLGLLAPERLGGSDGSLLDLAVVAEAAGRSLAFSPCVGTAARAIPLLVASCDVTPDDGVRALLADVINGLSTVCVADAGELGLEDGRLTGRSALAAEGLEADAMLTLVEGCLLLVRRTTAVTVPEVGQVDPSRRIAAWQCDRAAATVVLTGDQAVSAWDTATAQARVALAAECLGSTLESVERAAGYAKQRVAFGRQIGSFQAVKHAIVDGFVAAEQLRSLVWLAAHAFDSGDATFPAYALAALAYGVEAEESAARVLVQVHGGIGVTWEHDAHLYLRRSKVDRLLLGSAEELRDSLAEWLLERG